MRRIHKHEIVLSFQLLRSRGTGALPKHDAVLRKAVEAQTRSLFLIISGRGGVIVVVTHR
jgi:hypothetical protein